MAVRGFRMPKKRLARRIFKGLIIFLILIVLGLGALIVSIRIEHGRELTLPAPTGSFAVGRALYDWTDEAHEDTLSPVSGTHREVLVWLWYPAAGASGGTSDYLPPQVRLPASPSGGSSLFQLLTRDWSKVHAHGSDNAEVSPQQQS